MVCGPDMPLLFWLMYLVWHKIVHDLNIVQTYLFFISLDLLVHLECKICVCHPHIRIQTA